MTEETARKALPRISAIRTGIGIRRDMFEGAIHCLIFCCAMISVLTTIGVVLVLVVNALKFFRDAPVLEFFTGTVWAPIFADNKRFGVLPLVCGTTMIAVGAALFAVPLGLGTAVYLSEYSSSRVREIVKPMLELLAGVPSVVYGYVGLVFVSPLLQRVVRLPDAPFSALSACIVVGIMVLPMIVSLSEDVLRAVPRSMREAGYALGATKYDVTARVVIPAAMSGILASILLAISRAIGETMAVSLAAGAVPQLTLNPLRSVQTMTAYIAAISKGDTPVNSLEYHTIFAVGLTLFACTMAMNLLAQYILAKTREKYE